MVRIKVYKASHLAVAAAVVLLAVVLAAVLLGFAVNGGTDAVGVFSGNQAAGEVTAAFSVWAPDEAPAIPDPEEGENEHTDEATESIIVEVVRAGQTDAPVRPAEKPRVLIYHTHTHEAYAQTDDDPYEETEAWRTGDPSHSVVRVGEALAEMLIRCGFEVVHDQTDHEPPKLSTAYARSLKTLEQYADQPFDLYIDLHRDAYNESLADCAVVNGQRAAQLMALIGNGGEYEVKPDYEANLRFAQRLTNRINEQAPGLCREVMVKNGRYNQHVGTPSVLIEVGHNQNTLQEALASMPVLADALQSLMTGEA